MIPDWAIGYMQHAIPTSEKVSMLSERLTAYESVHGFDVEQTCIRVTVSGYGRTHFPVLTIDEEKIVFRISAKHIASVDPSGIRSIYFHGD